MTNYSAAPAIILRPQDVARFERKLYFLNAALQKTILDAAMMKGAEIALAAAKTKVPVRLGRLRQSLAVKKLGTGKNQIGARLLARRSKRYPGGFYSHLIERGHKIVRKLRSGQIVVIGYYSPHPYMRPAVQENRQQIINAIVQEVSVRLRAIR